MLAAWRSIAGMAALTIILLAVLNYIEVFSFKALHVGAFVLLTRAIARRCK